jgi:hypothetical protein
VLGLVHIADRILGAADRVPDLAFRLVHLPLGLQLLVAENLAETFLDGALLLLGGTFDPFLIHVDHDLTLRLEKVTRGARLGFPRRKALTGQ